MVQAVANTAPTQYDLKSLPGGYVKLKKLPYGMMLTRRAMVSKMTFEGDRKSKGMKGAMDLAAKEVTYFEFANAIVEHNLEDGDRLLNLANPADIEKLDPQAGQEIGTLIDKMNNLEEEEEDLGNSSSGSEQQ